MRVEFGFGGWVRASEVPTLPDGALAYVHFRRDAELGRLVAVEVYVESPTGERLRGEHLRRLPLDVIEAEANGDGLEYLDHGISIGAPLLGTAASYFSTSPPNKSTHWAADMLRSQYPATGVPEAPREPGAATTERAQPSPLTAPPDGRYTDEWYEHLADAYRHAVNEWRLSGGTAPAKALAEQTNVSIHTVRSWIYRARKAGFLPKGEQGRAG